MKKTIAICLGLLLLCLVFSPAAAAYAPGVCYYIDALNGSDETGDGLSPETAWKTVPVTVCTLGAGDTVFFRRGGVYECTLTVENSRGSEEAPICITAYGDGEKPILTTDARTEVLRLFDCSYITVSDLEITAPNGGGIWIDALHAPSEHIKLERLAIHHIQNYKMTARDNLSAGAAAARACVMVKGLPARSLYPVNGFTVIDCEMYDCGNGVSLWGAYEQSLGSPWGGDEFYDLAPVYNKNALIRDVYFHDMDAEAVIIGICDGALMTHCRAIDCCQGEGVDENGEVLYYTAAAWFWGSENSTIEYCEIAGQKNVGDGMTVDFDSWSNRCTYQYIYSHDNTRFMCNNAQSSRQQGNVVRYCLSVNDDRGRNKLASGAGEENMLFYNNTIVGSQRFDLDNIYDSYFVNNIIVMKDGFGLNTDFNTYYRNGNMITNNCYYNCLPDAFGGAKFYTQPGFSGTDTADVASFMLSNKSPLIGTGYKLTLDDCETDFFGNMIVSRNIGCYGGAGTDAPYKTETVFARLARLIRCLVDMLKNQFANNC